MNLLLHITLSSEGCQFSCQNPSEVPNLISRRAKGRGDCRHQRCQKFPQAGWMDRHTLVLGWPSGSEWGPCEWEPGSLLLVLGCSPSVRALSWPRAAGTPGPLAGSALEQPTFLLHLGKEPTFSRLVTFCEQPPVPLTWGVHTKHVQCSPDWLQLRNTFPPSPRRHGSTSSSSQVWALC